MSNDDWTRQRDERLQQLGLRPQKDAQPQCVHCGRPFNAVTASAGDHGLCNDCLFDD
jgi:hypothetical protein